MMNEGTLPDGHLAPGWATTTLGELIADTIGGDWGVEPERADGNGFIEVAVIRGTEFRDWDLQKGSTAARRAIPPKRLGSRRLERGDLVLEVSGGGPRQPVGRTALIDGEVLDAARLPLVCSNFCRRLRPTSAVDPAFMWWSLRHLYARGEFDSFQTQTTNLRNLNVTDLLDRLTVAVAPLAEQKRIVAKVEEVLARVNAARERLAKLPAILKRFRQSVLAAACSGRLTADWREVHCGDCTELAGWQTKQLGELFEVRTGGTPSRKVPAYFDGGTIPWVKTGEVQNCDIHAAQEHVTPDALDNSSAKVFPAGTLLVALYGEGKTRGQVGRLMIPAATNQACAALINTQMGKTTNEYVFFCLLGQYYHLRERAAGGNQPNLSVGLIRGWEIPVPPRAEQHEIVVRVRQMLDLGDRVEARVAAAAARAERLVQATLAKAFRGELVPTEAELAEREGREYETAEALLERVRQQRVEPGGEPARRPRRRTASATPS